MPAVENFPEITIFVCKSFQKQKMRWMERDRVREKGSFELGNYVYYN